MLRLHRDPLFRALCQQVDGGFVVPVLDDALHDPSQRGRPFRGEHMFLGQGFDQHQDVPVIKHLKDRADHGRGFLGDPCRPTSSFANQPADAAGDVKLLQLDVDDLRDRKFS